MKKYMKPELTITGIETTYNILTGSGGVTTDSTLGEEYTSTDVTYSRRGSLWEDEDEE